MLDQLEYRIAGNFHRTLFSEISETSRIFQKFFTKINGALKFFKPVAKKEKITEIFENIFPKYSLKRIFQKFKISGYTVYGTYEISILGRSLFNCDLFLSCG